MVNKCHDIGTVQYEDCVIFICTLDEKYLYNFKAIHCKIASSSVPSPPFLAALALLGQGIKPVPQQQPEPLQGQCWILNPQIFSKLFKETTFFLWPPEQQIIKKNLAYIL